MSTLCEFDPVASSTETRTIHPSISIALTSSSSFTYPVPRVVCLDHNGPTHVTHEFLACDPFSSCWVKAGQDVGQVCPTGTLTFFTCGTGQRVQYSFVCDHRQHCSDNSDEDFCVHPPCVPGVSFDCGKSECIPQEQRCDKIVHCTSGRDEKYCFDEYKGIHIKDSSPPPALVLQKPQGFLTVQELNAGNTQCPSSHFECPMVNYYCLPVYLRCNGIFDCPNREDEKDCQSYTCPGFYRCLRSRICVHADHMCDDILGQCPENDDELMCGFTCPEGCVCYGMAFQCGQLLSANQHLQLRYLNADKSSMTLHDVEDNTNLVHLSLAQCFLDTVKLPFLPNLQILDVNHNQIRYVDSDSFKEVNNLRVLVLRGNPLDIEASLLVITSIIKLHELDLSQVYIPDLVSTAFKKLVRLEVLNLSRSQLTNVIGEGFNIMPSLRSIDISMCPLTVFPADLFESLSSLQSVTASRFTFCCPALLPEEFNPAWCNAPVEQVSSCEQLLASNIYRVMYALLAAISVLGNVSVILFHTFNEKQTLSYGFVACIIHLCSCNLMHSIYLFIITGTDIHYKGNYLWHEAAWSQSTACQLAGFIFFVSFEACSCIIGVSIAYTAVIHRFSRSNDGLLYKLNTLSNVTAWLISIVIATCPQLAMFSQWQAYNQNGLCIPLPPTELNEDGFQFLFGVFNVLNITITLTTFFALLYIYSHLNSKTMLLNTTDRKSNEVIISQRLLSIAVFNVAVCLCVALCGFLAVANVSVSSEVVTGVMMTVPSLQAAGCPCIYLVNVALERQRKARQQYMLTVLARQHAK